MSRKITLTLAARRERTAQRVAWGLRWATYAAQQQQRVAAGVEPIHPHHSVRKCLEAKARLRDRGVTVRPVAEVETLLAEKPAHVTTVRPTAEAGRFIASCSCGGWSSRPLTERGAKGQATRHVNISAEDAAVAELVAA